MRRVFLAVSIVLSIGFPAFAGGSGLIIKGVFHSWDEVARMALKVSGRTASDDAIKAAAKTIKNVAGKYGDDIAEASARGGIEVAEQATKHGGGHFLQLVKIAGSYSDDSLRFLALYADDIVKYSAQYGDDIVRLNAKAPGLVPRAVSVLENNGVNGVQSAMRAMADLPAEDVPRVVGALEKNPSVARELVEHLEKGGKAFLDKLFNVNAKQIMAGGLTASMIVVASGVSSAVTDGVNRVTAPYAANSEAIKQQVEVATKIVDTFDETAQKEYVDKVLNQTVEVQKHYGIIIGIVLIVLVCFIGGSLMFFAFRKSRLHPILQQKSETSQTQKDDVPAVLPDNDQKVD